MKKVAPLSADPAFSSFRGLEENGPLSGHRRGWVIIRCGDPEETDLFAEETGTVHLFSTEGQGGQTGLSKDSFLFKKGICCSNQWVRV
jgi:hypothetical protein